MPGKWRTWIKFISFSCGLSRKNNSVSSICRFVTICFCASSNLNFVIYLELTACRYGSSRTLIGTYAFCGWSRSREVFFFTHFCTVNVINYIFSLKRKRIQHFTASYRYDVLRILMVSYSFPHSLISRRSIHPLNKM